MLVGTALFMLYYSVLANMSKICCSRHVVELEDITKGSTMQRQHKGSSELQKLHSRT